MTGYRHFTAILHRMGFYPGADGRWHADWRHIDPTLFLGVRWEQ